MKKFKLKIDWKYIIIEIIIVTVGITIAFQLNNWNESRKAKSREAYFINSFYDENRENLENIEALITNSETVLKEVDTLVNILIKDEYTDLRVKEKTQSLFTMYGFAPNTLTFENLQSSYGFELIQDIQLREKILKTYKKFSECKLSNESVNNYIASNVHPFILNNINFRPSVPLDLNQKEKLAFYNIVAGYYFAWSSMLKDYEEVKVEIKLLDGYLTTANKSL